MSTQKKIKIAIFHNLPRGGAKRYLYEISKRLTKKYLIDEYKLGTSTKYLNLDKFTKKSKTYNYFKGKGLGLIWRTLMVLPKVHKNIANDINKGKYDLIITNHDYFTKSPYIHRFLKIPSLYICHEPQREFYEDPKIHAPRIREKVINILRTPIKYVDRRNVKAATHIVVNSKYSRNYIKQVYGVTPRLVYPGVDIKDFSISMEKKNFVLAIGNLTLVKGHDFVIRSLGRIEKKSRPTLIVVGSSEKDYYENNLVKIAKANDVECKIIKKVTKKQLRRLYSFSIAYVSGAHREPFGLSVLEALASGTPVVIVKSGGAGEQVLNGKNGFVVKNDEEEFATKLSMIIQNPKYFQIKPREISRDWNWDKTTLELNNIIKEILIT